MFIPSIQEFKKEFWIPENKYEIVTWLNKNYSHDKQGKRINWNKFPKHKLLAIYIQKRQNENKKTSKKENEEGFQYQLFNNV